MRAEVPKEWGDWQKDDRIWRCHRRVALQLYSTSTVPHFSPSWTHVNPLPLCRTYLLVSYIHFFPHFVKFYKTFIHQNDNLERHYFWKKCRFNSLVTQPLSFPAFFSCKHSNVVGCIERRRVYLVVMVNRKVSIYYSCNIFRRNQHHSLLCM